MGLNKAAGVSRRKERAVVVTAASRGARDSVGG